MDIIVSLFLFFVGMFYICGSIVQVRSATKRVE